MRVPPAPQGFRSGRWCRLRGQGLLALEHATRAVWKCAHCHERVGLFHFHTSEGAGEGVPHKIGHPRIAP